MGGGSETMQRRERSLVLEILLLISSVIVSKSPNLFELCPLHLQDDRNGEYGVMGKSK